MDEVSGKTKITRTYAENTDTSPFDKTLPQGTTKSTTTPTRITYLAKSGATMVIALKKSTKYHQYIYTACYFGFQSDWFNELKDSSKLSHYHCIRYFFEWINKSGHKTTQKTRYSVLKTYETHCLNDQGQKLSQLSFINRVLKNGVASPFLPDDDYDYIQTLISYSKPTQDSQPDPNTLSTWFDLPWIRSLIGENTYLQLESPRLLFNSFRVTIGATLLYLLKQRAQWQKTSLIEYKTSKNKWYYDWNRIIIERYGSFNDQGEPNNELSELLLLDLVRPSAMDALKVRLAQFGTIDLPKQLANKTINPWQKPQLFHPDNRNQYSDIEQLLCGWLAACQQIQPTDIPKLKVSNFAFERTRAGRMLALQCTYFKGRSGGMKKTEILTANDVCAQAIDQYISGLSDTALFSKTSIRSIALTNLDRNSVLTLLFKIWNQPNFQNTLESEFSRTNVNDLFLRAILAIQHGSITRTEFRLKTGKSVDEYRAAVPRPLPTNIFTYTHIKNTAVHARSDTYRESDLVNHHSHSSLTEKSSYLTDKNKEWVDQAGRITRLVLHDLQNIVFKPSVTAISKAVDELELRTQIIEATHSNDISIHSLKSTDIETNRSGSTIVLDTEDTAIYFIHYISQAEKLFPKLLTVRPDWVERTLIVQVEWMTRTLTRMSATASAQKTYSDLAIHLPPLFDHLLETTE